MKMSGGLAPIKSTIYVSNLPFSFTNNDLQKILEKNGKVVNTFRPMILTEIQKRVLFRGTYVYRVTVMRDKVTRLSKGVAFVLYLQRDSAYSAVRALNNTQMFGRTIKCNIAKDNGRASEFIRKKNYPDKSKCYECGDEGHLSYKCPKNILGEREPPPKKQKKKKRGDDDNFVDLSGEESGSDVGENPKLDSLAAAINFQRQKMEEEEAARYAASTSYLALGDFDEPKRKRYKKDTYFSDEEEIDDDT